MARALLLALLWAAVIRGGASRHVRHRIINGQLAELAQFPYMAALTVNGSTTERLTYVHCSGTLLNLQWVLTTAYCTDGYDRLLVTLGAFNVAVLEDAQYKAWTSQIYRHPDYNPKGTNPKANDIAVLFLPQPVPTSNYIKLANLPTPEEALKREGLKGHLTGWGQTSDPDEHFFESRLKVANVSTIGQVLCDRVHPEWATTTQMCTLGLRKDQRGVPCHGDEGSPFVVKDDVVLGIVSYVPKSCGNGEPSVLTHVGSFVDWINSVIEPHG